MEQQTTTEAIQAEALPEPCKPESIGDTPTVANEGPEVCGNGDAVEGAAIDPVTGLIIVRQGVNRRGNRWWRLRAPKGTCAGYRYENKDGSHYLKCPGCHGPAHLVGTDGRVHNCQPPLRGCNRTPSLS